MGGSRSQGSLSNAQSSQSTFEGIPRYGKNAASVLLIIASTMASTGPCTLEGEARGVSCSSQASG